MASSSLLQAGLTAAQQQNFAAAVQALEEFCYGQAGTAQEQIQAQMWLVRAYHGNNQVEAALALCQQMATPAYPADIQQWATKTLPHLTTASSPSPHAQGTSHEGDRPNQSQPSLDNHASNPDVFSSQDTSTEVRRAEANAQAHSSAASASEPDLSQLSPEELLNQGNKALKSRKFTAAVQALEAYCHAAEPSSPNYSQAQMWLVKAYKGNGQDAAALELCTQLLDHAREYIKIWAKQYLETLLSPEDLQALQASRSSATDGDSSPNYSEKASTEQIHPFPANSPRINRAAGAPGQHSSNQSGPESTDRNFPKAGRTQRPNVKVPMGKVAPSLGLASGVTLSALSGMVFSLCLALFFILKGDNPTLGLLSSIAGVVAFNTVMFFLSPLIMDLMQSWIYKTRWSSLNDLRRRSPEAARVMQDVCAKYQISQPRIGIIEDDNPTAFTYGSLRNNARLVVSQGLFKYLDDDEVATVYAHELGHIVHWDFAIMTLAQTLLQVTYLIYTYARRVVDSLGNSDAEKNIKNGLRVAVWSAYVFYIVGEYILLYLSRTREYHADHFAAEVTGNPNALSRGLVKIAYGILEESKRSTQPSLVVQGTRSLGIADPKGAAMTGTAYQMAATPDKVGRVFLWDMFNPWAWWAEINSTHPLTGKRVRALSTYAEYLGLDVEFDMAKVMREGKTLNKRRLYGNFVLDLVLMQAPWFGIGLGLSIGFLGSMLTRNFSLALGGALLGGGIAMLLQLNVMYPSFSRAPESDLLTLMSDPYASPLRGKPVRLIGQVIGRGDAGNQVGSDLQFKDATGMTRLRYCSWLGPLGNLFFGWSRAEAFIGTQATVSGWFRRNASHWVDLVQLDANAGVIKSYHRLGTMVMAITLIVLGLLVPPVITASLRNEMSSLVKSPKAKYRTAPTSGPAEDSPTEESSGEDFGDGTTAPPVQ